MKTVLFATDHTPPDPKALDYALVLSQRLAARLEVLNIVQTPAESDSQFETNARHQLHGLYADHPGAHIDYRYEITGETIDATIERYVRSHREIVLTVFVPRSNPQSDGITKDPTAKKSAMPKLAIPLVIIKKTF